MNDDPTCGSGLTRRQTLAFAAAASLSVANIYAAQPILDAMTRDIDLAPATIGLVVTITQIGYGLGLILIVPLGDLVDRRRLILGQGSLSVVALLAVAAARSPAMLLIGLTVMGLLAVMVQVLVAFAATLAAPAERGKTVGTVTSGVVIGILAARFAAGLLADLGGWRVVYATSAALTLVMVVLLARILPRNPPAHSRERYVVAISSIPPLFLRDRVLLKRGLLALLIFAAFSTFWTALVLPLSAPPFGYSHRTIGLFGLVGMVGALAASQAGRLADSGFGSTMTGVSLALLLVAWGPIAFLPTSLPALVIGVLLLDLAVQAVHVTNQSIIFARYPTAHSRLIGGYMVFYSLGSALGAIASTSAYARYGWHGVCIVGAGFSAIALASWLIGRPIPQRDYASAAASPDSCVLPFSNPGVRSCDRTKL